MKKLVTILGVGASVVVLLAAFAPASWQHPTPIDATVANQRVSTRQHQVLSALLKAERKRHPALPPMQSAEIATANP